MNFLLLLSCFLFLSPVGEDKAETSTLEVRVTNLSAGDSNLMVAFFHKPEKFLTDERYLSKVISVKDLKETSFKVSLPAGEYAIAIFQDKNKNGKLDRNLFYYPSEPFGFSNNCKPLLRAPEWSDAAFKAAGNQTIEVQLN